MIYQRQQNRSKRLDTTFKLRHSTSLLCQGLPFGCERDQACMSEHDWDQQGIRRDMANASYLHGHDMEQGIQAIDGGGGNATISSLRLLLSSLDLQIAQGANCNCVFRTCISMFTLTAAALMQFLCAWSCAIGKTSQCCQQNEGSLSDERGLSFDCRSLGD